MESVIYGDKNMFCVINIHVIRFLAKFSSTITHRAIQITICIDNDAIADWYDTTYVQIIQQGSYKAVNGQRIYVYNETSNTRCTLDKSINRSGMAQKPTNNERHLIKPMIKRGSDVYIPKT